MIAGKISAGTLNRYRLVVLLCWIAAILLLGALSSILFMQGQSVEFISSASSISTSIRGFYFTLAAFFAAIASLGLVLTIFLSHQAKANLLLAGIFSIVGVFAVETALEFKRIVSTDKLFTNTALPATPKKQISQSERNGIDTRTKLEVIQDFKNAGATAYPNVHPRHLLQHSGTRNGLKFNDQVLFPLGNISNQISVQKNEGGYWFSYKTDRYGFHNDDQGWDKDVDVVMLGDSYAEGWAVRSENNVANILSNKGVRVINLGKAGNGPLLEYASLVEYGTQLDPKVVLWMYFENDIESDLLGEWRSDFLKQYFLDGFTQHLPKKQEVIDQLLISLVGEANKERAGKSTYRSTLENAMRRVPDVLQSSPVSVTGNSREFNLARVSRVLARVLARVSRVTNLRERAKLTRSDVIRKAVFRNLMSRAKTILAERQAALYFVYLPAGNVMEKGKDHSWRKYVLETVSDVGIVIIDAQKEVFEHAPALPSLFPFGNTSKHYNEEGYRILAEGIWSRIKQDFDH